MEKVKEFLKDTKKTVILGLISSILICCYHFYNIAVIEYSSFSIAILTLIATLTELQFVGFLVYFIILLMRLYKKKGNIKLANRILAFSLVISLVAQILSICISIYIGIYRRF